MRIIVENCPAFEKISECIAYAITIRYDTKAYRIFESECEIIYPCDDNSVEEFEGISEYQIDDIQLISLDQSLEKSLRTKNMKELKWIANAQKPEDYHSYGMMPYADYAR